MSLTFPLARCPLLDPILSVRLCTQKKAMILPRAKSPLNANSASHPEFDA